MFIQTQETPNPATLKFLPGQPVFPGRTAEFRSIEETDGAPLAKRLFGIAGVERVFFGADFISVSKTDDRDWDVLKTHILGEIMQHYASGLPAMEEGAAPDKAPGGQADLDNEIVAQIVELLETRVRPAVAQDGGDISFVSFDESDGTVYLRMQGACAGCPSATMTLKAGIENMLKHYIPEVNAVEPVMDYG